MSLRNRLSACDAQGRTHLGPDELVLAIGKCEDVTEWGGAERGAGGRTYVMVTDRRLRWVPEADLKFEASLDLASITRASDQMLSHRYAIALRHQPLARLHRVPAHRFLTFEWGNAVAKGAFSQTKLAFSRRDTDAAYALREQLGSRGLL